MAEKAEKIKVLQSLVERLSLEVVKKKEKEEIVNSLAWVVERYSEIYVDKFEEYTDALISIGDLCAQNNDYFELLMHIEALYADWLDGLSKRAGGKDAIEILKLRNAFAKHMEALSKLRNIGVTITITAGMWVRKCDCPNWIGEKIRENQPEQQAAKNKYFELGGYYFNYDPTKPLPKNKTAKMYKLAGNNLSEMSSSERVAAVVKVSQLIASKQKPKEVLL